MASDTKDLMNGHAARARDEALEGARRAAGNGSPISPPDPAEVVRRRGDASSSPVPTSGAP